MISRTLKVYGSCVAAFMLLTGGQAYAASIVLNGSLEDLNGNFANTSCQYMALGAGSSAIANWTVAPSTTGNLVWADSPTCDGYNASLGSFFVDLSGFGANSPNGSLQQQLTTVIGQSYLFSVDLATFNDGPTSVVVGPDVLALSAGSPFIVGNTSWTPYTATFIASITNPLLTITKTLPGADIVFVDNVSIVAQGQGPAPVPEPASVFLVVSGLAAAGAHRWRQQRRG